MYARWVTIHRAKKANFEAVFSDKNLQKQTWIEKKNPSLTYVMQLDDQRGKGAGICETERKCDDITNPCDIKRHNY